MGSSSSILIIWPPHPSLLIFISSTMFKHMDGHHMDIKWPSHGHHMTITCPSHGNHMDIKWPSHDHHMDIT
jgi:hypothetical protein